MAGRSADGVVTISGMADAPDATGTTGGDWMTAGIRFFKLESFKQKKKCKIFEKI